MKSIRLFLHKYRYFYSVLIIVLMLVVVLFFKDKELLSANVLKGYVINMQEMVTPKVDVNYSEITKSINDGLEQELEELNKLLELNNNTSFTYINASVLSRNVNTYFSNITIDKGKSNGIDINMAVVTNDGLVGYISKIYDNYSIVSLLNSKSLDKKIAVCVTNGENIYNANITGYDLENDELIVTSIRSTSKINIGDKVMTNGLGKVIPSGILIGYVKNVEMDEDTSTKKVMVELSSNIDNIKYVGVIKGVKE